MRHNPFAPAVAEPAKAPAPPPQPRPTSAEILMKINAEKPELVPSMVFDREWLWYCHDGKPEKEIRDYLSGLKFRYIPAPHLFSDGRQARWYYWSGKPPLRRRNNRQPVVAIGHAAASRSTHSTPHPQPVTQTYGGMDDLDSFILSMSSNQ